jgi:hypothetical protein
LKDFSQIKRQVGFEPVFAWSVLADTTLEGIENVEVTISIQPIPRRHDDEGLVDNVVIFSRPGDSILDKRFNVVRGRKWHQGVTYLTDENVAERLDLSTI